MRAEACRIAKQLADEYGGKPSSYMKEAWVIVKDSHNHIPIKTKNTRMSRKENERASAYDEWRGNTRGYQRDYPRGREKDVSLLAAGMKIAGSYLLKKTVEKTKSGVKSTEKSVNFMKPPKDSPKDVFSGASKMFTKAPQKVEVPDGVKSFLKDTFRFK